MQYLKAIYAGVAAGIGSAGSAYVQNPHIGVAGGLAIATSVLLAFGATLGVTNAPKPSA